MGNEVSLPAVQACTVVIHSDVGDITTCVNDPNDTWSQLCRRTIEDYLLPRLLSLLVPLSEKRLGAYRLRYDTGFATVVKPIWRSNRELPVEDAFLDVNVSLRPRSARHNDTTGPAFLPHETILTSVVAATGDEEAPQRTVFVDVHCERIAAGVVPFPATIGRTRVLLCTEHQDFSACIAHYRYREASEGNPFLPARCINGRSIAPKA